MVAAHQCRVPPRRAGNFLLLAQKKVTKEEGLEYKTMRFVLRAPDAQSGGRLVIAKADRTLARPSPSQAL
jgi:hypothetical protein